MKKHQELFNQITNEIINIMEQGQIPWEKPWGSTFSIPHNGVNKHKYNGTNLWLMFLPYTSQEYYTFKQIKELKAYIRKGEKGHIVLYWSMFTPKDAQPDEEGNIKKVPILKYYFVWNREQIENLPEKPQENTTPLSPIEAGEEILTGYKDCPEILFGGDRALYSPSQDVIRCPDKSEFKDINEYYSTLFHELIHSTGNEKRLNRAKHAFFGDCEYSKEELIAELGSAFLCSMAGISSKSTKRNNAAYLQGWLKALRNDMKLFFDAATYAGKAVEYIKPQETSL